MQKTIKKIGLFSLFSLGIVGFSRANSEPKVVIDPINKKILIQSGDQKIDLETAKSLSGLTGTVALTGTATPATGNQISPPSSTETKPSSPQIKNGKETGTELERAISRMYANELTKYDTLSGYRPQDPVTRQEAAKIIAQAYRVLGYPQTIKNTACSFSDAQTFDPSLSGFIVESCQRGIFKGTKGAFLAGKTLSKAETLTVLMRIFEGVSSNESLAPRWTMYFIKAKAIGLTKENNVLLLDRPTTREELALLIYRFKNLILNSDNLSTAKTQLNTVNQNPTSFLQNISTGATQHSGVKLESPILSLLSGDKESSSSLSILNNPEISEAMYRMREYGLTNASDISTYLPFENLTREQAAKMLVQFAKVEKFNGLSTGAVACAFSDLKKAENTLVSSIQDACRLGLMQGSNGAFQPKQILTKSEFITLLIRLSEGKKLDENQTPWWKNYFIKARDLGLINNDDVLAIETPITRYEAALIFYRFWIKQKILSNLNTAQLKNELISTIKNADGAFLTGNGAYQISIDANLLKNQFFQEGFLEFLGQRYILKKTNITTFDIANESFVWYGDMFAIDSENRVGNLNLIVSNGNIISGVLRLINKGENWTIRPNASTTAWFEVKKL